MFIGCIVCVHSIKFNMHIVIWSPPPIVAISSNIVHLFLDATVIKFGKSLKIYFLGSLNLVPVKVWVLFNHVPWNVTRIVLLYFKDVLLMISDAKTSDPVSQSYFVISMKKLKVEFVPDNRSLSICKS